MKELLARINDSDGPPEGIPTTGIKILVDENQGTAVVEQYYRAECSSADLHVLGGVKWISSFEFAHVHKKRECRASRLKPGLRTKTEVVP